MEQSFQRLAKTTYVPYDPVCGETIDPRTAYARVHYNDRDYYLCCPRCRVEFESNPQLCESIVRALEFPQRMRESRSTAR
jgi:YHS domain-containing protein